MKLFSLPEFLLIGNATAVSSGTTTTIDVTNLKSTDKVYVTAAFETNPHFWTQYYNAKPQKNVGSIFVSCQLLAQKLGLPEGTEVRDMRFDLGRQAFEIRVAHSDIPKGEPIMEVTYRSVQHYCPDDGSVWNKTISSWKPLKEFQL